MKVTILVLSLLLGGIPSVHAVPGESRTTIESRLGTCKEEAGHQFLYRTSAGDYLVSYHDGISVIEHAVTPIDPTLRAHFNSSKPPYPATTSHQPEGIGLYEAVFDHSGNVASVSVVQSAHSILDASTISYVRKNWHGPADASLTFTATYHFPPR